MTATAYYSVCSPTDPLAVARREVRRAEYLSWRACLPDDEDGHRDWTTHAATMTASIGGTPRFIAAHLDALTTVNMLPGLRTLVEQMHHLDMFHLRKIDDALLDLPTGLREDEFFWDTLDEVLVDYLTPTRANQLLPTPGAITRKIRGVIRSLAQEEDTEEDVEDSASDSFRQYDHADGSVTTEVRLDAINAAAVEQAVRDYAAEHDCSFAQAFTALLLNNVQIKVVLNVYRAHDVPDAPGWLYPAGWLSPDCTRRAARMAATVRDMDEAATAHTGSYRPTGTIRASWKGGTARVDGPGARGRRSAPRRITASITVTAVRPRPPISRACASIITTGNRAGRLSTSWIRPPVRCSGCSRTAGGFATTPRARWRPSSVGGCRAWLNGGPPGRACAKTTCPIH